MALFGSSDLIGQEETDLWEILICLTYTGWDIGAFESVLDQAWPQEASESLQTDSHPQTN